MKTFTDKAKPKTKGLNWGTAVFLIVAHLGIRVLQLLGLARGIKRARFDSTKAAWRLVSGKRKRKRLLGGAQA